MARSLSARRRARSTRRISSRRAARISRRRALRLALFCSDVSGTAFPPSNRLRRERSSLSRGRSDGVVQRCRAAPQTRAAHSVGDSSALCGATSSAPISLVAGPYVAELIAQEGAASGIARVPEGLTEIYPSVATVAEGPGSAALSHFARDPQQRLQRCARRA